MYNDPSRGVIIHSYLRRAGVRDGVKMPSFHPDGTPEKANGGEMTQKGRHGNSCSVQFQGKLIERDFDEMTRHARRENAVRVNNEPSLFRGWPEYQGDRTNVRELYEWGMKRAGQPVKRRARGNWIEISEEEIPSNTKIMKAKWDGKRIKFKYTAENGMIRLNEKTGKYEQYEELPIERADLIHCLFSVSPELMRDKDGKNIIGDKKEEYLIRHATAMTGEIFGKNGLLLARYDRDEAGIGVVDVFALPIHNRKRGNKEEVELNHFAAIEAWRKRKGFTPPINKKTGKEIVYGSRPYARWLGTLIQDEWHRRCKNIFPNIERGLSKDVTKRKNLKVSEYKELMDRISNDEDLKKRFKEERERLLSNKNIDQTLTDIDRAQRYLAELIAETQERERGMTYEQAYDQVLEEVKSQEHVNKMLNRSYQKKKDRSEGPSGPSF